MHLVSLVVGGPYPKNVKARRGGFCDSIVCLTGCPPLTLIGGAEEDEVEGEEEAGRRRIHDLTAWSR